MNIEPKEDFGGISGFEGYPPDTNCHNNFRFCCDDPGDGGDSGGGDGNGGDL